MGQKRAAANWQKEIQGASKLFLNHFYDKLQKSLKDVLQFLEGMKNSRS